LKKEKSHGKAVEVNVNSNEFKFHLRIRPVDKKCVRARPVWLQILKERKKQNV